jgi:hypothetical protein
MPTPSRRNRNMVHLVLLTLWAAVGLARDFPLELLRVGLDVLGGC